MNYEYWPVYWAVNTPCVYHVADKRTGDLECKPGTNTVLEFLTVADVMRAYPGASYCAQMAQ